MICNSIGSYLEALEKYKNTRWKITPNGNFAWVNDNWVSEIEYNQHNTKPYYEPAQKENPDSLNVNLGVLPNKQH